MSILRKLAAKVLPDVAEKYLFSEGARKTADVLMKAASAIWNHADKFKPEILGLLVAIRALIRKGAEYAAETDLNGDGDKNNDADDKFIAIVDRTFTPVEETLKAIL
jgi:hypothetical protein